MKKEVDVAKVLSLQDGEVGTIQEQLSPEARKNFNMFLAKFLAKKEK